MQPIAEADYFLKTKEFQQWLSEARKTFLDEIPAEEARANPSPSASSPKPDPNPKPNPNPTLNQARALFRKFVAKWNAKELPPP